MAENVCLQQVCPLCGEDNRCAMATGQDQPCWCKEVTISQETLAAIPEPDRGQRCICQRCANKTGDTQRAR